MPAAENGDVCRWCRDALPGWAWIWSALIEGPVTGPAGRWPLQRAKWGNTTESTMRLRLVEDDKMIEVSVLDPLRTEAGAVDWVGMVRWLDARASISSSLGSAQK